MEDEKTEEASGNDEQDNHYETTSSPKKADAENSPNIENDESTKTLETKSAQLLDIPTTSQQNLPNNLESLDNNNGNKIEGKENVHNNLKPLENNNGIKTDDKLDLSNNLEPLESNNGNKTDDKVKVPNDLETLKNNNGNKTEVKLNEQVQESVGGNSSGSVAAQTEPPKEAKKRVLSISYSSPAMKLKEGAKLSKQERGGYSSSPIAPVKQTVSKFGGIIDWKAHKQHTLERRKFIQLELEKANEEIPVFKKQCENAEEEKQQIMKKLNSTKRVNEDLKLNLERAHIEEQQARQDAELAILRMEELEKGIVDESSVACKAQLELAKARYDAAVSDLKVVQAELEQLQQYFTLLSAEKASAILKAEEAVATSKKVEKSLEDLSIELINTKDSLESAQAGHLEAEERRTEETAALEQDVVKFENELREAEEELEKLDQKFTSAKNVKAKLVKSLELLQKLKGELNVYMESEQTKSKDENHEKNRGEIEAAVKSAKKELEETNANIKKAIDEIKSLKESASSLNSELKTQKSEIIAIKQRGGVASIQENEKQSMGAILELPEKLQQATRDANHAKSLVELRHEEYRKAKEEARQVNNEKNMVENRFLTAQKEIEVAKVAEKLALDSIKEQQESESSETINEEDSQTKVTLTLEEYYEHNMRALEAEEDSNKKVLIALSEIDAAKESEIESLNKLEEIINNEISYIKKELEIALQKVKIAKEGKLYAEEELQKWRSEQQIQKEAAEALRKEEEKKQSENSAKKTSHSRSNSKSSGATTPGPEDKPKKKKRSIFPRFFMFMGRKKSSSSSSSKPS